MTVWYRRKDYWLTHVPPGNLKATRSPLPSAAGSLRRHTQTPLGLSGLASWAPGSNGRRFSTVKADISRGLLKNSFRKCLPLKGKMLRTSQTSMPACTAKGHLLFGLGPGRRKEGPSRAPRAPSTKLPGLFMKSQWPKPAMSILFRKSTMLVRLASCISAGLRGRMSLRANSSEYRQKSFPRRNRGEWF